MTSIRRARWVVALLAAGYGLPSVFGALVLDDITLQFRLASLTIGALLVVGAILLLLEHRAGVVLLWLSAGIYALVMLLPALQRHGLAAFSVLMGTFYVSLSIRIVLAVAAHALLSRRHG